MLPTSPEELPGSSVRFLRQNELRRLPRKSGPEWRRTAESMMNHPLCGQDILVQVEKVFGIIFLFQLRQARVVAAVNTFRDGLTCRAHVIRIHAPTGILAKLFKD